MNGAHLATGRYEIGNPTLETERAKVLNSRRFLKRDAFDPSPLHHEIDNYIYLRDESEDEHEEHEDDHGGLILANYATRRRI